MNTWKHPSLGLIELIPSKLCPKKVWRHFYNPDEHWERLCNSDIDAMRGEAEGVLGVVHSVERDLSRLTPELQRKANDLLVGHHNTDYAPAYRLEMSSADTYWTSTMDDAQRHQALTPSSVFIVVQLDRPRSWVVTAFRPSPPCQGIDFSEDDFRRHGKFYFCKETGVDEDHLVREIVNNLQRCASVPRSPRSLWWLASAVGYGRLLNDFPLIRKALPAAENVLATTASSVLEGLRRSLGWDLLLTKLAAALKEQRPEYFEAVLVDAEELLAVASAIGAKAEAGAFCTRAEQLIPWLPAEWGHLAKKAGRRMALYSDQEELVLRLWKSVEGAALSAQMRESEPSVHFASQIADQLIPLPSIYTDWLERIAALPERMNEKIVSWVEASIDAICVQQAVPTMGSGSEGGESWEVRGKPGTNAPAYRVFIVDNDYPNGYDVTENFSQSDGFLWQIDSADDRALVVVIAGSAPLDAETLEALLAKAAERDDLAIRVREIQPTQVTKAMR